MELSPGSGTQAGQRHSCQPLAMTERTVRRRASRVSRQRATHPTASYTIVCSDPQVLQAGVVGGFGFRRRDVADRLQEPAVIEPVDPFEGRQLDGLERAPRALAPVLPKGNRPQRSRSRRSGRRCGSTQRAPQKNIRLAHTCRSSRRTPAISSKCRCCDDRLSLPCTPRSEWWTRPPPTGRRS